MLKKIERKRKKKTQNILILYVFLLEISSFFFFSLWPLIGVIGKLFEWFSSGSPCARVVVHQSIEYNYANHMHSFLRSFCFSYWFALPLCVCVCVCGWSHWKRVALEATRLTNSQLEQSNLKHQRPSSLPWLFSTLVVSLLLSFIFFSISSLLFHFTWFYLHLFLYFIALSLYRLRLHYPITIDIPLVIDILFLMFYSLIGFDSQGHQLLSLYSIASQPCLSISHERFSVFTHHVSASLILSLSLSLSLQFTYGLSVVARLSNIQLPVRLFVNGLTGGTLLHAQCPFH